MPANTASETYLKRYRKIMAEIGKLTYHLESHKKKQKNDKKNWSFPGDLGWILDRLKDLNKNFK